jgi:hypothetical protein
MTTANQEQTDQANCSGTDENRRAGLALRDG